MSVSKPASPTPLPKRVTEDLVSRILDNGELGPEEVAELKPLVPLENIRYRPSDAALLCSIVPSDLNSKVLPPNDDKNASVYALCTAIDGLLRDDSSVTEGPVLLQTDCQELRICLVSRSRDDILDLSFFVVPSSELSSPSLLEQAAHISHIYACDHESTDYDRDSDVVEFHYSNFDDLLNAFSAPVAPAGSARYGAPDERPPPPPPRIPPPQRYAPAAAGLFRKKRKRQVAEKYQHPMLQFTSPGPPPPRDCRLCVSLGLTVGLFRGTTFQVDGKGGFIVEEKSRLREDLPGTTIEVGATVGLQPATNVTVEKQLPDTTYLRVSGAEHLKLVFEKMRHNRTVRWWFISMLLTETLWVDADSKADSFLPSSVRRRKGNGLRLDDPIPASYFDAVGGTVFSVGDDVFFKVSSVTKIARKVEHVDEGGCLHIGDNEIRVRTFNDETVFWRLNALEIA